MGNLNSGSSSRLLSRFAGDSSKRLLITGLDAAGKTTLLYKLKLGEVVKTIPTIGFNVETLAANSTSRASPSYVWTAWDMGGRDKIRPLQRHYYPNTQALVYIIDSTDPSRFDQARDELVRTLTDEDFPDGVPLLILCNKQDLPNALPPQQVVDLLGISTLEKIACNGRLWRAIGCSAISGEGLDEGMQWLNSAAGKSTTIEQSPSSGASTNNEDKQVTKTADLDSTLEENDEEKDTELSRVSVALGYDPAKREANSALRNFRPIQLGTECPFAKSAKLWGVATLSSHDANSNKANALALAEFIKRSNLDGKNDQLDGFCIELPPDASQAASPEAFGRFVYQQLKALSDIDPSGENSMRLKYIGARGWRFRFARADFFVTTFAPCYPKTSSRYAFGTNKAFILLQPERSFLRHDLPPDTPETNTNEKDQTVRDKTRLAFQNAGRGYYIPPTTKYPPAEHIVKPLLDNGNTIIRWWHQEEDEVVGSEAKVDEDGSLKF